MTSVAAPLPVLIAEDRLQQRIAEIARQISADYAGREVTLVCTLAGSVIFVADLIRQLTIPAACTFLHTATYGTPASGEVRIVLDTSDPLEGRHLIVFEGAVVTGSTLKYVMDWLQLRRPASLRCCALIVKRQSLKVDVPVEYVGFELNEGFAVGYGIAHRGRFRGLPYIADARGIE
jgi:hypoxanthine phosphoribosyltransferase